MKKTLSLILSIVVLLSLFSCLTTSVSAGNYDTIFTARSISMNTTSSGSLTADDSTDIFKFTLNYSSKVDVELHSTVFRFQFFLMNESGEVIYSGGKEEGASGLCTLLDSMVLVKGVYYFRVTKNYESRNGTYEITFKSSSAGESFVETESDNNNSILTADSIIVSRNYKGQIALNDKSDFYVLNLPATSTFSLNFMSDDVDACYVDILDEKGTNVKGWYLTQGTNDCVINSSLLLLKGKYYIVVKQAYGYGNYNFSYNYSSCGESFEENYSKRNDTKTDAYSINLNTNYKGVLALNEGNDYYKFKLSNKSALKISFQAELLSACYVNIYDSKGNTVYGTYLTMGTNNCVIDKTIDLAAGEYCLAIVQAYGNGTYNFNLSDRIATPKAKAVNTLTGMNVTWNAVDGAVKYVVYKRLGTSSTWDIVATTTGLSYADNNTPLAGSYYIYSIKAYNSAGTPSDYVKANCATVQRVIAPYTKAVNASNGINVTWGKVAGANKYVVLRRIGTENTWKTIGETTGTSFLDKNVKAGIYYIYSIRAVNNTGYSAYDINKRITIMRILTPVVTATNVTNGVQIKWNAVTSATKYNVYRRPGGTSTFTYVGTTTGTSFVDKDVKNGTYYIYSVRAYNGASYSAYIYGNTDTIQPITAPTAKAVNKSTGVQLSWNSVTGATKYNVYRRLGGTSNWIYVGTTTGTSLLDKSVVDGKTYAYSIRAINGTGYSAYNSSKCVAIKHT